MQEKNELSLKKYNEVIETEILSFNCKLKELLYKVDNNPSIIDIPEELHNILENFISEINPNTMNKIIDMFIEYYEVLNEIENNPTDWATFELPNEQNQIFNSANELKESSDNLLQSNNFKLQINLNPNRKQNVTNKLISILKNAQEENIDNKLVGKIFNNFERTKTFILI